MKKTVLTLLVGLVAVFSVKTASADLITHIFSLSQGSIDGQNVTGERVTMKVDFTNDQTFSGGSMHLTNPTVTFSITNFNGGAEFSHDTFFNQMELFSNSIHRFMLLGVASGRGGSYDRNDVLAASEGDTLADYFDANGDGTTINYVSENPFTPLFGSGDTINNGAHTVDFGLVAASGSADQVIFSPIPEPTTPLALMAGATLFGLVRRKRRR